MPSSRKILELVKDLIALCHTPRDQWCEADRDILREARRFIREQEKIVESSDPKVRRGQTRKAEQNK